MPTHVIGIDDLQLALRMYAKGAERATVMALRKTAVFGKTAVAHTIQRTRDPFRIRATGTYQAPGNWVTAPTSDGAVLFPTAKHAKWVERGRPRGKKPPFEPILEWVYAKGLAKRARGKAKKKPKGEGDAHEKPAGLKKPKKKRKEKTWDVTDPENFARNVQWKIKKRGTKARWPLRRTMPRIAKRASREIRRALRDLGRKPPPRSPVRRQNS